MHIDSPQKSNSILEYAESSAPIPLPKFISGLLWGGVISSLLSFAALMMMGPAIPGTAPPVTVWHVAGMLFGVFGVSVCVGALRALSRRSYRGGKVTIIVAIIGVVGNAANFAAAFIASFQ